LRLWGRRVRGAAMQRYELVDVRQVAVGNESG